MKILEAAPHSDADHSYNHLHVTVSLADGVALQMLGALPAADPISQLCLIFQFWMCEWTLGWAKGQESKGRAALRSDAELSIPCPFA